MINIEETQNYNINDIRNQECSANRNAVLLNCIQFSSKVSNQVYKKININNRRYLGNKYKLSSFIKETINRECGEFTTFADLFAGTGAVASMFTDKKIILNDILYSNYICHVAWFGKEEFSLEKVIEYIEKYNSKHVIEDNYVSENFADTYFSKTVCRKIGYIREDIEKSFKAKKINERERAILITSLLYAMDKIANTCGHYDAYRKKGELTKQLELCVPNIKNSKYCNNLYNKDINALVKDIEADVVYLDPPYNSRQYCDAYHLLENIALWQKPEVSGVAKKMDRTELKSDYCTQKAVNAFEDLINNINAGYIVLSYNNMADKGDDRSNAKITDKDILRILKNKGEVKIFTEDYKAFTTGKSTIEENQERLFVCKCFKNTEYIQSPLNYTGGKYKLLKQMIEPVFPKNISTFVDLFAGGCNVGINVEAQNIIFNDKNIYLKQIFEMFKTVSKEEIFDNIYKIIYKYNLSDSSKNSYKFYGCESNKGLSNYNKNFYLKLRQDYNNRKYKGFNPDIMLYVLILYAFNNQIRFNSKNEFNLPVGKRDFNKNIQQKLSKFLDRIKAINCTFLNFDFRDFDYKKLDTNSFFYADPPYLITCATYNEQSGWTEKDEKDLLNFLNKLDKKGYRFALSNVLKNKGNTNLILSKWIKENKYKVHHLNHSYSNSNYQTKDKITKPDEVLITNY